MPTPPVSWKLIPLEYIEEIRTEIEARRTGGLIDPGLYREYLAGFSFKAPESMLQAKSVAVFAVPQPMLRLTFIKGGRAFAFIVPPTYFDAAEVDGLAVKELKRTYGWGHNMSRAFLPLKLLACRAGLALYGRNNITYVRGWGSFFRLTAFFTDIEAGDHVWQEPGMLPECENCRICIDACPAKVMSGDRFMARAERCMTYLNEKPSGEPFPEWASPSWHNAVIGCMICQRVCPANRGVIGRVEDRGEFSEEETGYLLGGDFSDRGRAAAAVEEKLKAAGLDLSAFPRNLRVFIERSS